MATFIQRLLGTGARVLASAANAGNAAGPDTPSADAIAMAPKLQDIENIIRGADAVRACGKRYLPQYEKESDAEYKRRLAVAPWRPEFTDALDGLVSQPFRKTVTLTGEVDPKIELFADNVDGRGNSLTVFAREFFGNAIAKGLGAFLVDFPVTPNIVDGRPVTLADERAMANKPYWVEIAAGDILSIVTEYKGGRDVVTHFRFRECATVRDGFAEKVVDRIRVLELNEAGKPAWQVYELTPSVGYELVCEGTLTAPEIPVVLMFTGRRFGSFGVKPPLGDLASMQFELYRALSREDETLTYASSPMLAGQGLSPPGKTPGADDELTVGPKTILYAPPGIDGSNSRWEYVGPDAALIEAVAKNPRAIIDDMRRHGLQPTLPNTGNVTATGQAIDASKAHSKLEAWAMLLKDALDLGLKYTAHWLSVPDTTSVSVFTDFTAAASNVEKGTLLVSAGDKQILSRQTVRAEMKRSGILSPEFDEAAEEQRLAEEQQGLDGEFPIDPVTGTPIARAA